jgi:hypothetical protein
MSLTCRDILALNVLEGNAIPESLNPATYTQEPTVRKNLILATASLVMER